MIHLPASTPRRKQQRVSLISGWPFFSAPDWNGGGVDFWGWLGSVDKQGPQAVIQSFQGPEFLYCDLGLVIYPEGELFYNCSVKSLTMICQWFIIKVDLIVPLNKGEHDGIPATDFPQDTPFILWVFFYRLILPPEAEGIPEAEF